MKTLSLQLSKLALIIWVLFAVAGCDENKFKSLQSIAIIDAGMNPNILEIEATGRPSRIQTLIESPQEEPEKTEFLIQSISRLKDTVEEKSTKIIKLQFKPIIQTKPHKVSKKRAQKWAILHDVDAVASIYFQFYIDNQNEDRWEAEKDPFKPRRHSTYWRARVHNNTPTKMILIVTTVLRSRNGDLLMDREQRFETTTEEIEVDFEEVAQLEMSTSQAFNSLIDEWIKSNI